MSGVSCGLKANGQKDVALLVSDMPCTVAGVFTSNRVKAAPVVYDQGIVASGKSVRAVVINAGNANACTGGRGMANTQKTAAHTAGLTGCDPGEVLVLSTGVIGVQLPMDKLLGGIEAAAAGLTPDGWEDAARAIMTTDTRPKIASIKSGAGYTITGIAKGAGMIAPNMATMLAVIATDAKLPQDVLQDVLHRAVGTSFNRIVVDGDMSTNDTVLLLANAASGVKIGVDDRAFIGLINAVCRGLAMAIVRDGEGATKLIVIRVGGAPDVESAQAVARAIASSPLCKTAFYGADPNWGRVVCAAGYSGVEIAFESLSVWLAEAGTGQMVQLVSGGEPVDYDESAAVALMQGDEWELRLDLGMGGASALVWTCDLSPEYVMINGHYRT